MQKECPETHVCMLAPLTRAYLFLKTCQPFVYSTTNTSDTATVVLVNSSTNNRLTINKTSPPPRPPPLPHDQLLLRVQPGDPPLGLGSSTTPSRRPQHEPPLF